MFVLKSCRTLACLLLFGDDDPEPIRYGVIDCVSHVFYMTSFWSCCYCVTKEEFMSVLLCSKSFRLRRSKDLFMTRGEKNDQLFLG